MKRTANFILLILSLILPSIAEAQTGWVRMPDGPWGLKIAGVYFLNRDTGFVEERNDGSILYFTFDGGQNWLRDTTLKATRTGCIRKDDLVTTPWPRDHHMNSHALIFAGELLYSGCSTHGSEGAIWKYELSSRSWKLTKLVTKVDTLLVLDERVLFATMARTYQYDPSTPWTIAYRTLDSGSSWHALKGVSGGYYGLVMPRFQNVESGYVRTMIGTDTVPHVYHHWTSDAGKSWREVYRPVFDSTGLSWDPYYGNNGLWYDNSRNGLLATTDLGVTWGPATVPPILKHVVPDDAFYSFVEGYRVLRIDSARSIIEFTDDSAWTWVSQETVSGYLNEISAPTSRVAYAVGPNGVWYKTTDGGGRFADVKQVDVTETKLRAWSSGDEIIIEGAEGGEIRIFDLLGRLVRAGREEPFGGMQPGVYVVVSRGESVTVLVSP